MYEFVGRGGLTHARSIDKRFRENHSCADCMEKLYTIHVDLNLFVSTVLQKTLRTQLTQNFFFNAKIASIFGN